MAEKCGFFNSNNGDRKYKADFFAEYFASFIANGVFPNPSTGCQVMSNGNMTVTLKLGKAWINGFYYNNDSDLVLPIDVADGVLKRIDRIVLQYSIIDRTIRAVVRKGTFASTPEAPVMQRNADYWELAIADILIANGAISVTQSAITDLRLNDSYCGIVHGLVNQADMTTIFNQYYTWFEETKASNLAEFQAWFDDLQYILSGDVAGNLYNLIEWHKEDKVYDADGAGVHGFRIVNREAQFYDTASGTWKVIRAGTDIKMGNVTGLSVTVNSGGTLTVKWSDPTNITVTNGTLAEWGGTQLRYKLGTYPSSEVDGTLLVDNKTRDQYKTTGFTHTGLTNGVPVYYMLFPYTRTEAVTVDAANRITATPQNLPVGQPLSAWTWDQINQVSVAGTAASYFSLGDAKSVTLSTGTVINLYILGFAHDDRVTGGKAGITFGAEALPDTKYSMNPTLTNNYGWDGSHLRGRLNGIYTINAGSVFTSGNTSFYSQLPEDLRTILKQVKKYTSGGSNSPAIKTSNDYLFILSEVEIFGTYAQSNVNGEGSKYPIFTSDYSRVKRYPDSTAGFWITRSFPSGRQSDFIGVDTNGYINTGFGATTNFGICFGLCV